MKHHQSVSMLGFLLFALVWAAGSSLSPQSQLSADSAGHLALARALVQHQTLDLADTAVVESDRGAPLAGDGALSVTLEGGGVYGVQAPGMALAASPVLVVASIAAWAGQPAWTNATLIAWIRFWSVALPAALLFWWIARHLQARRMNGATVRWVLAAFGLSAAVLCGTAQLSPDLLAGACVLAGIAALGVEDVWPSAVRFFVSGVLLAVAVLLAHHAIVMVLGVLVYAWTRARQPRQVLPQYLVVAVAAALLLAYHATATGTFGLFPQAAGESSIWGVSAWNSGQVKQLMWSGSLWWPLKWLAPIGFFAMVSQGEIGLAVALALGGLAAPAFFVDHTQNTADTSLVPGTVMFAYVVWLWPVIRAAELVVERGVAAFAATAVAAIGLMAGLGLWLTHPFASAAQPVRDVAVPMWLDRVFRPSLGHTLGLSGTWAVVPLLVIAGYFVWTTLRGPTGANGGSRMLSALCLGTAGVLALSSQAPMGDAATVYDYVQAYEQKLCAAEPRACNKYILAAPSTLDDKGSTLVPAQLEDKQAFMRGLISRGRVDEALLLWRASVGRPATF